MDPQPPAARSILETRSHQMFATLAPAEIERLRRFGEERSYRAGEYLAKTGEVAPGMFILLRGEVVIRQHDDGSAPIVTHGPGSFTGELAQLSGRPSLVDGIALGDVEVLVVPPHRLRSLLVEEAELGERILRGLILRRIGLIERGAGGPVIVGTRRKTPTCCGSRTSSRATRIRTSGSTPTPTRAPARCSSASRSRRTSCRSSSARTAASCATRARSSSHAASVSCRRSTRRRSTTWRSSARARRGSRPRCTRHPRASRCSCSTAARSAVRRAPRRASRTTSASRPASPASR